MLTQYHKRLRKLQHSLVAQDIANVGFDFVATPLRRSSDSGDDIQSLQPLTYTNALLAPVGRSGQARTPFETLLYHHCCEGAKIMAHRGSCDCPYQKPNSLQLVSCLTSLYINTKYNFIHIAWDHVPQMSVARPSRVRCQHSTAPHSRPS